MTAAQVDPQAGRLRLLLNSSIVVAAEPYVGLIEPNMAQAAELVRLANELGHVLCVAPATRDDIPQGADPQRRAQRLGGLGQFSMLGEVPISASVLTGQ